MSTPATSGVIEQADHAWATMATGDEQRRALYLRLIRRLRAELSSIERGRPRGNTTLKICHPEGVVRKAFLADREL